MASQQTDPWPLLKTLAYTCTEFVGFNMAATSILFMPPLLRTTRTQEERSTTARHFASVNELSMKYNIPLEILSMISYGALAHRAYFWDGSGAWKGWAAAVAIIGTIFPLKNMLMAPLAKAVAGGNVQGPEFKDSLQKWSTLNLVRGGIVLSAAVVATLFGEV